MPGTNPTAAPICRATTRRRRAERTRLPRQAAAVWVAAWAAAAVPGGTPADSIGAALKAAMDILQADASSAGAPGSADDQLSAGYGADKNPTPATGMKSKY
jgi:hypothetical protein